MCKENYELTKQVKEKLSDGLMQIIKSSYSIVAERNDATSDKYKYTYVIDDGDVVINTNRNILPFVPIIDIDFMLVVSNNRYHVSVPLFDIAAVKEDLDNDQYGNIKFNQANRHSNQDIIIDVLDSIIKSNDVYIDNENGISIAFMPVTTMVEPLIASINIRNDNYIISISSIEFDTHPENDYKKINYMSKNGNMLNLQDYIDLINRLAKSPKLEEYIRESIKFKLEMTNDAEGYKCHIEL